MKAVGIIFLAAIIAGFSGFYTARALTEKRAAQQLASERSAWEQRVAELEDQLRKKPAIAMPLSTPGKPAPSESTPIVASFSPTELLQRIVTLGRPTGPIQTRQLIKAYEELIATGTIALPVIDAFLNEFKDVEYDTELDEVRRGWRNRKLEIAFVLGPTLRISMMDAALRIGGPEAEGILSRQLGVTGRGVEVAYLTVALHNLTKGSSKDAALAAAQELLTYPINIGSTSRLDRNDREYLYGVLEMYGDASYASIASGQLVGLNGAIDRNALRYLEETLGTNALSAINQAYHSLSFTNAAQKEPLVDFVLEYTGENATADQLFATMMLDPNLPANMRAEAIRELDDEGIDDDNPSDRDKQVAFARLQLLQTMKPNLQEPRLAQQVDRMQQSLTRVINQPPRPPREERRGRPQN